MVTFNYQNTSERDIDRLICEELYCSQAFFDLFLAKISRKGAKLVSIFHSKRNEFGETDIEVIYEYDECRHAILIEDKISAEPQPDQAERYKSRGEKDVKEGLYVDFYTFIVAPQRYINNPANMADKYDYHVTHDEIVKYFCQSDDPHNEFRRNCFSTSLVKCQYNSRTMKYEALPEFFVGYAKLLESSEYRNLQIIHLPQTSTKPNWVHLQCEIPGSTLMHKCSNKDPQTKEQSGFIDVILNKYTQDDIRRIAPIVQTAASKIDGLKDKIHVEAIGKTQIGIRMRVNPIYYYKEIKGQESQFQHCLKALSDMYELTCLLSDKL